MKGVDYDDIKSDVSIESVDSDEEPKKKNNKCSNETKQGDNKDNKVLDDLMCKFS